jgi:hypothetical protein
MRHNGPLPDTAAGQQLAATERPTRSVRHQPTQNAASGHTSRYGRRSERFGNPPALTAAHPGAI